MAVYRQIHVSYWQDAFVLDLTPEEKYFYLYLMTNSKTRQCGVYELPKRIIELETGFNRETVDKLLVRFVDYGKIEYCSETKELYLRNWLKYNSFKSPKVMACIHKEIEQIKHLPFKLKTMDSLSIDYDKTIQADPQKEKEEEEEEKQEEQLPQKTYPGIIKEPAHKFTQHIDTIEDTEQKQQLNILVQAYNACNPIQHKQFGTGGTVKTRQVFEEAVKSGLSPKLLLIEILYDQEEHEPKPWEIVSAISALKGLQQTIAYTCYDLDCRGPT